MLIWGQRLYGKCDRVPHEFYVATKFFHFWFIPLIPLESWIVIEGSDEDDGWDGASISMHWRSVIFAYVRAALVLGAIFALFTTWQTFHMGPSFFALPLLGAVIALGAFVATKIFDKSNEQNTIIHARFLGVDEETALALARGEELMAPHAAGPETPTGG